ncbi:LexA family protein [Gimesia fumaroli]|uniref:LexA repressor n=1 Tax=Gimesia fumaroli TaxID=2527976 RepID=A0A518I921_9PLAN|nr:hypothetical protein [Gimesia fumaroli]QDV49597.1 LexA repressor [Gimesia fumaroli]
MITKMVEEKQERQKLTDRQKAVYEFVRKEISENRLAPTVRNIGDALGIKSPNGVMCHLKALERKGWITRGENAARSIKLVPEKRTEIVQLTPGQSLNVGGVMVGVVGVGEGEVNLEVVFQDNQDFSIDG